MKKHNYFLYGIILAIVIPIALLIAFVIFSRINSFELVENDYYRKEINYQQQIDKELQANKLSQAVSMTKNNDGLTIIFPTIFTPELITGNIQFYRPSNSNLDFTIPINLSINSKQLIGDHRFEKGLWVVKIYWRVHQIDYFTEKRIMYESI